MAVFKCKMCGGTLEITNETVAVCEYCGTKQTLPKLDDEKRANLYDRANHFRRNNEFDKAAGIYEQILNEDNTDAEAYWSLVLCRYGIEYVEDPSSRKRVPTVNRAQYTSIFDDNNYRSALQYADAHQRSVYEEEAKAINTIQKGILAISQKEEPFDVFICYKETDHNGRRTPDSVLAQELYYQLTQEGFKVFFSRITLEDKLGSAYEPYIFAALNSAKVMVALGTKPEYFNAVWVKNEWSRYLSLIKQGQKKMLIPAYKDMDPYDLPEEFSHLQAQDMSRLGFMQDLTRGIKKIATPNNPTHTVIKEATATETNANIVPLLKRAFLFLEDGDWRRAEDFCEQVLNMDPECAEAYLCKLMLELHVRKREQLGECDMALDENGNYQKALRFADDSLKRDLIGYIDQIKTRQETARIESAYQQAKKAMSTAKTEASYKAAAVLFEMIRDYADSDALANECYEKAEIARIEAEKRAKRNKKIAIITTPIVCAIIAFIVLFITVIIPAQKKKDFIATYGQEAYDKLGLVEKGAYISFGEYEQDNNLSNGKEDIEWLVLDVKDGKALVISKYALDCRPYNTSYEDVTWETCTLRKWLNNDFINAAFSDDEKNMIYTAGYYNTNYTDVSSDNNILDKIFLLSESEVVHYFPTNDDRQVQATNYAKFQGAYVNIDNRNCLWWLRQTDDYAKWSPYIISNGDVSDGGSIDNVIRSVRPALWIDLTI